MKPLPGKTTKAQPRPLPPHLKSKLKKQLDDWLDSRVIEPAPPNSPWSSPLVPVKKKNGETRWAVDYRVLIQFTVKDHRPIPNVMEKLANIKSTNRKLLRYFGSIDLQSAFNHTEVAEDSKIKTAITTPLGLFVFKKMGFGLQNAPGAFSDLVRALENRIAKNTKLAEQALMYFDDALLCASTWKDFMEILEAFLKACKDMDLRINPKKCTFGLRTVTWLGHELSDEGIRPAKTLTDTIRNWSTPQNVKELRSLFGTFSYYRRFIHGFAERTAAMRKLLQKDAEFVWTKQHDTEMEDLKEALTTKPILAHPDFTDNAKTFVLYVDSSKTGVGAVLMQEQPVKQKDGSTKMMEVVPAYGSKALNQAEQHYGAYKKELLGIIYDLNHFRYYLQSKRFIICTDHKGLEWLTKTRASGNAAMVYRKVR